MLDIITPTDDSERGSNPAWASLLPLIMTWIEGTHGSGEFDEATERI